MLTAEIPTRLVKKTARPATEKDFMKLTEWIQSAYGKGFPLHAMMRVMMDELYTQERPSFFDQPVEVTVTDVEPSWNQSEGTWFAYTVKVEATLPIGDTDVPVTFYLTDKEQNPSVEAAVNVGRIMELAVSIAVNGLLTPVGVLEEYAELTTYLHNETK